MDSEKDEKKHDIVFVYLYFSLPPTVLLITRLLRFCLSRPHFYRNTPEIV